MEGDKELLVYQFQNPMRQTPFDAKAWGNKKTLYGCSSANLTLYHTHTHTHILKVNYRPKQALLSEIADTKAYNT